ncbi:MAG TPA: nucleotide exchange factor GrpE [Kineosporiaceae bacterium]|nr:nucleotide exchange factor GrpE [Kineosporiaceae bacterium]
MTDPTTDAEEGTRNGPVIRDRRKIDPETGRVREAYAAHSGPTEGGPSAADEAATGGAAEAFGDGRPAQAPGTGQTSDAEVENGLADQLAADLAAARSAAEERLADLQRLQAEYVNYRRRVDRDRDVARDSAIAGVLEALLPALDDVHLARQHGDLESGPFAAIADKLEATLSRLGLSRYGEPGETFDPNVHEALMHTQAELAEGTTEPTVVQVLQPGYRFGERVLRPARVAVADPQ